MWLIGSLSLETNEKTVRLKNIFAEGELEDRYQQSNIYFLDMCISVH